MLCEIAHEGGAASANSSAVLDIAQFAQSDIKNSTAVGTGGTSFMRYLAQHRDATRKHLLA